MNAIRKLWSAAPWIAAAALALLFGQRLILGARLDPPRAGERAAEFALPDLGGNRLALSALRGRPVLLNFWATWCPPCRAELPALEALARERPGCLSVVGVTMQSGSSREVAAFARDRSVTYPLLMDDGSAARAYGIYTLPTSVLIGPDGTVLGRFRGAVTGRGVRAALSQAQLDRC